MQRLHFFFPARTLAQRALAAARILAMPAADMRRFGRAVLPAPPARLAHRAFCAAEILRRAAADIVLRPR